MANTKQTQTETELDMDAVYDDTVATDLYRQLKARMELLEREPNVAEARRAVAKDRDVLCIGCGERHAMYCGMCAEPE